MEQIIETGAVTRGWVGIGVQDLTPELADTLNLPKVNGALITEVVNGSPADKAGIKPGDCAGRRRNQTGDRLRRARST